MVKITKNEINKKLKECGFSLDNMYEKTNICIYSHHNWDHGYDSWGAYEGPRREFYEDLREMYTFFRQYIEIRKPKEVVIAPLHRYEIFTSKYFKNSPYEKDLYEEMSAFLGLANINKSSQSGIKCSITEIKKYIEMILEGNFRGITELCFFFPDKSLIIEPNHHFELIFFTNKLDKEKDLILELIKQYKGLKYIL